MASQIPRFTGRPDTRTCAVGRDGADFRRARRNDKKVKVAAALIALALPLASCGEEDGIQTAIDVAPYGTVQLYHFPKGAKSVVISFSDAQGWRDALANEAWGIAWPDSVVAGVDVRHISTDGQCVDYAAAARTLGAAIADKLKMPVDETPFLIGTGNGASMAYATAVQNPSKTEGLVVRDFCPAKDIPPPCGAPDLTQPSAEIKAPVIAISDPASCKSVDMTAFMAALPDARTLAPEQEQATDQMIAVVDQTMERVSTGTSTTSGALRGLPVEEVPAQSGDNRLAVILTGDGGWADIDKSIAETLAKQGVAAVGFNSLKYFWREQSPDKAAADLERVIRHYMTTWKRERLILVGFSFGADVLPFLYPRLSPDIRQHVTLVSLLSPTMNVSYEVSVGGWVGAENDDGPEVAPAIAALDVPVLCVQNEGQDEHPCPLATQNPRLEILRMKGDHHFNGIYEPIAKRILAETKN